MPVEVVVELLHVLAVIALAVGQAEEPLLQNRDRGRSTARGTGTGAGPVGDAGDAVLAPAVGAASGRGRGGSTPRRRRPAL